MRYSSIPNNYSNSRKRSNVLNMGKINEKEDKYELINKEIYKLLIDLNKNSDLNDFSQNNLPKIELVSFLNLIILQIFIDF